MNCQEFWNAAPRTAPPQTATPQWAEAAAWANHEHLAHCPGCAARLKSQLALKKGLRAVAGQMSGIAAPPRVEARLLAAFRAHAGTQAGSWQATRAPSRWIAGFTWAAACAALLAIAVFLSADAFVGNHRLDLASLAVSPGAAVSGAAMPAEIDTDGGTAPVAESGFIPLPNAAQIGPNEEVNLVRVEVPRSAMIALGYDVKPEEASESVQADVMLGNDGLARAVRFLD